MSFALHLMVGGLLASAVFGAQPEMPRHTISLDGDWLFQREGAASNDWKTVAVPSSFQSHEGTNFHGVGWYRKSLEPLTPSAGQRVLLHFDAAATEAEVWLDDKRLGTHLGGWTPFRFDITDALGETPGQRHDVRVRLDEKVGHNTQGFLPIIAPHFGGLWQGVALLIVPGTYVDDTAVLAIGDPATGTLRLDLPLKGSAARGTTDAELRCRLRGQTTWSELAPTARLTDSTLQLRASIPNAKLWSPAEPNLYEVEISLPGEPGDRLVTRAAFRSIAVFGPELRLNGHPLNVRGILNWGYSAPLVEPNPGEAVWRKELEFALTNGFNLMKFCLWVPPRQYLEMADEMGVLTWMEYPTWHPNLTEKFLEPLRREFREFFLYDRNHPSVILRSLTCETGASAELKVIQSLYDAAHEAIPGAVVEDDSSWIGWNRVHDFYDDHPYGNNSDWVKRLEGFNEHILAHGLKPLVLGETTAADTWVDRKAALERLGGQRLWWAPAIIDDMAGWTERMRRIAGPGGLDQLTSDSLRYGFLMRKFQMEAFRREVPYGGYVITVIRDIPMCSMGLLDYQGKPKWSSTDWQWQRDTMCLLKTENDRRSFSSGERLEAQVLLSHFGLQALEGGRLEVGLEPLSSPASATEVMPRVTSTNINQNPGTLAVLTNLDWPLPQVTSASHFLVRASLKTSAAEFRNEWPVWVVPPRHVSADDMQLHSSLAASLGQELFPGSRRYEGGDSEAIVVAAHFDDQLASFLESGGRVLLLPDGQRHSFALDAHWFLRGAPYVPDSGFSPRVPRELWLEVQPFDLSSQVVPNLAHLDAFDPILLLWDTHDQRTVKTHGLVFETRVGKGRMLVSALRHGGKENAAGRWLLGLLLEHLQSAPSPRHALPDEVWQHAKARLRPETVPNPALDLFR
ncbi:MAG TPA: sugar-binding domain-containing protein [Verrucomicrobiae bacterium]